MNRALCIILLILFSALAVMADTVTTVKTDVQANNTAFDKGGADEYHDIYFRFALPEISMDYTITAAVLRLEFISAAGTLQEYASYCEDGGTAWVDGSSETVMATVLSSATATDTSNKTIAAGGGTYDFDVLGTSTTGILGRYNGTSTPTATTVRVNHPASEQDFDDTASTSLEIESNALFHGRDDVTYYPRLVITYTVPATPIFALENASGFFVLSVSP